MLSATDVLLRNLYFTQISTMSFLNYKYFINFKVDFICWKFDGSLCYSFFYADFQFYIRNFKFFLNIKSKLKDAILLHLKMQALYLISTDIVFYKSINRENRIPLLRRIFSLIQFREISVDRSTRCTVVRMTKWWKSWCNACPEIGSIQPSAIMCVCRR